MRSIARIFNTSMRGTRHKHKHNKNVYYIEFAIYRNGCKDVFFLYSIFYNSIEIQKLLKSEWSREKNSVRMDEKDSTN